MSDSFHNWYKANKKNPDWPYLLIMEGADNEQGYWFCHECAEGNKECLNKDVLTIAALVISSKILNYKEYFEKDYPQIIELAAYQLPETAIWLYSKYILKNNDLAIYCCKKEPKLALCFLLDYLSTNVDLLMECIKAEPEYAFNHDKVLTLFKKKKSKKTVYELVLTCPDYCLDKLSDFLGKYYPLYIDKCINILEQRGIH